MSIMDRGKVGGTRRKIPMEKGAKIDAEGIGIFEG